MASGRTQRKEGPVEETRRAESDRDMLCGPSALEAKSLRRKREERAGALGSQVVTHRTHGSLQHPGADSSRASTPHEGLVTRGRYLPEVTQYVGFKRRRGASALSLTETWEFLSDLVPSRAEGRGLGRTPPIREEGCWGEWVCVSRIS